MPQLKAIFHLDGAMSDICSRTPKVLVVCRNNDVLFREAKRRGQWCPKEFLALFLAVVAALAPVTPLWAQDSKRPIYPKGFEVTTDWQYSCPDGKGCSFNCPGSGGANNVTKLSIFLGSVPIGKNANSAGIFYEFTSTQTLRGSGFAVTTGIGTLACQVQGMTLD